MRAVAVMMSLAGLGLAGCNTSMPEFGGTPTQPASVATRPASVPIDGLVGRWGIASYRADKDRKRTEAMARAQCKNPYVITKGPRDGVMMHVADDPKLYELTVKGGPDGKNYLGFDAPPGDLQDREILSWSNDLITMRFVDPDVNTRYGTYIYVRCGSSA
jgi:hypothetical protein